MKHFLSLFKDYFVVSATDKLLREIETPGKPLARPAEPPSATDKLLREIETAAQGATSHFWAKWRDPLPISS